MFYPQKESSIVEWKRELPKNDQILKTVIAFCNQKGGKIVIGVSDSGEIIGLNDEAIQHSLEYLNKAIYESCHPTILPRIYTQQIKDKMLLIIEVLEGSSKPYFRKSLGETKGTYIRLGRSTIKASEDVIRELKWHTQRLDFEALPYYRGEVEDLDQKKIQDFLKNRIHSEEVPQNSMKAYGLTCEEQAREYPSNLAILLFGKETQIHFTEAMIICSHFKGVSGREALASIDCNGTLFDQFSQCYHFIVSRLPKSFKIDKPIRDEELEIPSIAIREALLNALIHRNYHIKAPTKVAIFDDRIEVHSPGSFPGPLDVDNLKSGITYLRNPIICKIFREAGYVEKLGTGFISIFAAYEEKGLKEPKVWEGENFIKVTLPRIKEKSYSSISQEPELNKLFAASLLITIKDVQKTLGVSRQTASRKMNQWINKGRVERIGNTRATRYRLKNL